MSQFDLYKALRWREELGEALLDRKLARAFEAGEKTVAKFNSPNWESYASLLDISAEEFHRDYIAEARDKDEVFHPMLGTRIARAFVDSMTFEAQDESGNRVAELGVDATLSSRYYRNGRMKITFRLTGPTTFARDRFHYLRIASDVGTSFPENHLVIRSGYMR